MGQTFQRKTVRAAVDEATCGKEGSIKAKWEGVKYTWSSSFFCFRGATQHGDI